MKSIYSVLLSGAALALSLNLLRAQTAVDGSFNGDLGPVSAVPDSIVQIAAESAGLTQLDPADVPMRGATYWWVLPGGLALPSPCLPPDVSGVAIFQMATGQYLLDETHGKVLVNPRRLGMQAQPSASAVATALTAQADSVVNLIDMLQGIAANQQVRRMARAMGDASGPPGFGDGGDGGGGDWLGFGITYTYPTNGLWLSILGKTNGLAYVNLHCVPNLNSVYAIYEKTDLAVPGWTIQTEVFPPDTNQNVVTFTVPMSSPTNLFIWTADWTDVYTNGLPCWWIWKFYHDLSETAETLDSQNNTLGYDYTNGLDPNVITFAVSTPNLHVNHAAVPVQISLQAGTPAYIAVLVNDTNYANAIWQPYAGANITMNLGATNGNYNAWVGLRGLPDDAQQTWNTDDLTFTLDHGQPTVFLTNPGNLTNGGAVVIKPYLQLQGYATKPVASLSCDVSNAEGVVANLAGQVTDVAGFDAGQDKYLTNYFQCYDVPLATNANVITLRVTDLAGNTTTTNFTVTLDYSLATNPPVLNVIWPQDGMAVSGSNITIRGTMSDETGTVQAQVVDADSNTNTYAALVERNNMFWIENVPLNGASQITLQATDAAGHMTTNSLTISPSDLLLTIGSTPSGDGLYQPSGSVSGTVGDPNATVMVNGTNAAVDDSYTNADGSYNWAADNVPIYGMGTATFDAVAYPPSQNNAGMSRAMTAARPMFSNNTPPPANASLAVTMDPAIVITHYNFTEIYGGNFGPDDDSQLLWARSYDRQWQTNANGLMQQTYQANETVIEGYGGPSPSPGTQNWSDPAPFYPDGFIASDWDADAGSLDVFHSLEQGVHHHWDYVNGSSADVTVGADTHWTLYTGGKSGINRQTLFELYARAYSFGRSPSGPWDWGLYWYLAPINGVVGTGIEALGQAFGSDSLLWTVQPGNAAVDLLINTPGNNDSKVDPLQQNYPTIVTANNNVPLLPNTVTNGADFCVGQGITFDIAGLPSSVYNLKAIWTLPGKFVNTNSDPNCDLFYEANTNFLKTTEGTSSTHCWYVQGTNNMVASVRVLYRCTQNGRLFDETYTGMFNVHRPTTAQATPYQPDGTPTARILNGTLSLGVSGVTNDMSFSHTITTDGFCAGQAGYVQVINSGDIETYPPVNPINNALDLNASLGEFPRGTPSVPSNTTTNVWFCDAPSVGLPTRTDAPLTEDVSFSTYLMFQPPGGIWVPLRKVDWELHDHADPAWTPYNSNGGNTTKITGDNSSIAFPDWTTHYP